MPIRSRCRVVVIPSARLQIIRSPSLSTSGTPFKPSLTLTAYRRHWVGGKDQVGCTALGLRRNALRSPRRGFQRSTLSGHSEFCLNEMEYFSPQCCSFYRHPLQRIQTCVSNLTPRQTQQHSVGILRMTTREKLNLAGLAHGVTATFVWIGLLGIALSRAVEWLL